MSGTTKYSMVKQSLALTPTLIIIVSLKSFGMLFIVHPELSSGKDEFVIAVRIYVADEKEE